MPFSTSRLLRHRDTLRLAMPPPSPRMIPLRAARRQSLSMPDTVGSTLWQDIPTVSTQGLLFLLTRSGQSTTHSSTIMELCKAGSTRVGGTTQRYGEEHTTSLLYFYSIWGVEWANYRYPLPEYVYDIYMKCWKSVRLVQ